MDGKRKREREIEESVDKCAPVRLGTSLVFT